MIDLSSGEKTLLAVILLLYQTSGETGLARMPKVLLLDEVDSHLHPTYTKVLIDILHDELVEKCGLSVILTTHAPSTVALAPDGCVFELTRRPREIRPITPSQATQVLSSGFISITPSDIVVITESSADPDYYQSAHDNFVRKGLLKITPSLKFIPASKRTTDGEGGGCQQVRNWAPKLHDLGLERFRGLIDRDSGNPEDAVVKVVGRYSVENYIYDPLAVGAFLIHHGIAQPFTGLKLDRMNAAELLKMDQLQIQNLVNQFCDWLAGQAGLPAIAGSKKNSCAYLGFGPIEIPKWWTEENGKEIERVLQRILNPLAHNFHRTAPIKDDRSEIVRFQMNVLPELLSMELVDVFRRLQS